MKRLAIAIALVLGACGGGDVGVDNVAPHGSVGGIVLDAATRLPIADVLVKVYSGGRTPVEVRTNVSGEWGVPEVASGPVLAKVSKTGYVDTQLSGTLASAAGNFPLNNAGLVMGPIGMLPSTGAVTVRLVNENGEPVGGVKTVVRSAATHIDYSSGGAVGAGQLTLTPMASDASTGNVVIDKLPDLTGVGTVGGPFGTVDELTVEVPAVDSNMDGVYDFLATTKVFSMLNLPPTPTVVLRARSVSLFVEASTIDAFESAGFPGGTVTRLPTVLPTTTSPIYITFNHPLDMMRTTVQVVDELGVPLAAQPGLMLVGSSTMRLTPPASSMQLGQEYNLWVHAVASVVDQNLEIDLSSPFFVARDPNMPVTATVTRDPTLPGYLNLTFTEPVGVGSAVRLTGSNCVLFYAGEINVPPSPPVGNNPGEVGHPDCSDGRLFIETREPNPPGPVGLSGYSRYWIMSDVRPQTGTSLGFDLVLSRVPDASLIIELPSGEVVPDFSGARRLQLPPNP